MDEKGRFRASFAALGALVSGKQLPLAIPSRGSSLYRACRVVCLAMGFELSRKPQLAESLEEICSEAEVRSRPVRLVSNWWQQQCGHLLAFWKDSGGPVALIFHRGRGYEWIDPTRAERGWVDGKQAANISLKGHAFYHPLPQEKLSAGAFFSLSLRDLGHELFLVGITSFLAISVAFIFPIANKVLFDLVVPGYNLSLFAQVVLGLFAAASAAVVFNGVRAFTLLKLQGVVKHRLQIGIWDRLLKLPVSFFRSISSGDLVQRTALLDQIGQTLTEAALRSLLNGIFSMGYVVLLFYYSWQLAFVGLGFALLVSLFAFGFGLALIPFERNALALRGEINSFLTQVINGIGKLRVAAAERRIFAFWAKKFEKRQRSQLRAGAVQAAACTVNALLHMTALLFVFWVATDRSLTLGTFMAFNAAFMPFFQALFSMAETALSCVSLIPFWERLHPLLSTAVEPKQGKLDPGDLSGALSIEKLAFRYDADSPHLFEELTFDVAPGACVGIVGPTGCGKSTLCRLLLGFEKAERGEILYDGKEIDTLDQTQLRGQIGSLLQSSALFAGSVYDNIVCGSCYSKEQVERALHLSEFEEDLSQLPMGLHTEIVANGVALSGGQRQRLLLARALVKEPKILILDEALCFLDHQTQLRIASNLEALPATRIMLSHCLSTLKLADRIYVIEKGRIVASGTFSELLR